MSEAIDETGMLLRAGAGFELLRDSGGRYRLELARMPVDLVEKRVRLVGIRLDGDVVQADGVAPA